VELLGVLLPSLEQAPKKNPIKTTADSNFFALMVKVLCQQVIISFMPTSNITVFQCFMKYKQQSSFSLWELLLFLVPSSQLALL
jgi:hypothetical protein